MLVARRSVLIGAGSALVANAIPTHAAGLHMIGGPAFGTSWRITLPDGSRSDAIIEAMRLTVGLVDTAMSPFRPDSEISKFNASDVCDWQALSPAICTVVAESLEVATLCGGAFDLTVGPIVGRYGFGPIHRFASASYLDISSRQDAIKKSKPAVTLDLCGIAKGYALDRMVALLDADGITNFLIELGGEVFARGTHPNGRAWHVGVERPGPGPTVIQRIVRLDGRGLATSGDAVNGYTIAGRRYSHIIDPYRREPADNGIASVSVVMSATSTADAFATAFMAMGPEEGVKLAESHHISALFMIRQEHGFREVMTADFGELVVT